jgi:hypothetical protein
MDGCGTMLLEERPTRAACPNEFLREVAFVLYATQRVRQAITSPRREPGEPQPLARARG